ncbi:hypothetical protein OE88DRAFT_262311 [Heliocybe sulcata]|uniref:Uncharacterized protein n=1 Tax=Heliocybe sulcata TaxID=5364 RepID=A0A5C3MZ59_9AGAM|nr:hypothetical protein OE88DRAFT_262311 [Heliocybe sulcata]
MPALLGKVVGLDRYTEADVHEVMPALGFLTHIWKLKILSRNGCVHVRRACPHVARQHSPRISASVRLGPCVAWSAQKQGGTGCCGRWRRCGGQALVQTGFGNGAHVERSPAVRMMDKWSRGQRQKDQLPQSFASPSYNRRELPRVCLLDSMFAVIVVYLQSIHSSVVSQSFNLLNDRPRRCVR